MFISVVDSLPRKIIQAIITEVLHSETISSALESSNKNKLKKLQINYKFKYFYKANWLENKIGNSFGKTMCK